MDKRPKSVFFRRFKGYKLKFKEDSSKVGIGEIFNKPMECETVTWRIPSASSTILAVDTELQSPCFYYKHADWLLKMYPYGRSVYGTKSWIDVVIQRLHSKIIMHKFSYRLFLESQGEKISDVVSGSFLFDSDNTQRCITFFRSFCQMFVLPDFSLYHDRKHKLNDTISLVCEIKGNENAEEKTELFEDNLGICGKPDEDKTPTNIILLKSIGELVKESFEQVSVAWQILHVYTTQMELDKGVQSPTFCFAAASWIIKMSLGDNKKFQTESIFNVAVERLDSEIPNHSILYKIYFRECGKNKRKFFDYNITEESLELTGKKSQAVSGCTVFNSKHTQEKAIMVIHHNNFLDFVIGNGICHPVVLVCELRTQNCSNIEMNSLEDSVQ